MFPHKEVCWYGAHKVKTGYRRGSEVPLVTGKAALEPGEGRDLEANLEQLVACALDLLMI